MVTWPRCGPKEYYVLLTHLRTIHDVPLVSPADYHREIVRARVTIQADDRENRDRTKEARSQERLDAKRRRQIDPDSELGQLVATAMDDTPDDPGIISVTTSDEEQMHDEPPPAAPAIARAAEHGEEEERVIDTEIVEVPPPSPQPDIVHRRNVSDVPPMTRRPAIRDVHYVNLLNERTRQAPKPIMTCNNCKSNITISNMQQDMKCPTCGHANNEIHIQRHLLPSTPLTDAEVRARAPARSSKRITTRRFAADGLITGDGDSITTIGDIPGAENSTVGISDISGETVAIDPRRVAPIIPSTRAQSHPINNLPWEESDANMNLQDFNERHQVINPYLPIIGIEAAKKGKVWHEPDLGHPASPTIRNTMRQTSKHGTPVDQIEQWDHHTAHRLINLNDERLIAKLPLFLCHQTRALTRQQAYFDDDIAPSPQETENRRFNIAKVHEQINRFSYTGHSYQPGRPYIANAIKHKLSQYTHVRVVHE